MTETTDLCQCIVCLFFFYWSFVRK